MKQEEGYASGRSCPACGEGQLRKLVISERYEYVDRGKAVVVEAVEVPIESCDSCGESFAGPEAARIRYEALGRSLGLLTPIEIAEIRQRSGMTLAEFAEKVGAAEEDVARWERGRSLQDRVVDNLLRVLFNDSEKPDRPHEELLEIPSKTAEASGNKDERQGAPSSFAEEYKREHGRYPRHLRLRDLRGSNPPE